MDKLEVVYTENLTEEQVADIVAEVKPTALELAMEAAKKRKEKQAALRAEQNRAVTKSYQLKR